MLKLELCLILLDATKELALLFGGLESSVTVLGGSIDELESNILDGGTLDLVDQRLTESQRTTLGSDDTTLNHEPVLFDLTVMREATQRSDVLLSQVVLSAGTVLVLSEGLTDTCGLCLGNCFLNFEVYKGY